MGAAEMKAGHTEEYVDGQGGQQLTLENIPRCA